MKKGEWIKRYGKFMRKCSSAYENRKCFNSAKYCIGEDIKENKYFPMYLCVLCFLAFMDTLKVGESLELPIKKLR